MGIARKCILGGCAAAFAFACTGEVADFTFTNRFATFTNLQGRLYEHVELVRAIGTGIIYRHGGESELIRYTNLSDQTIEGFGISADRKSASVAAEKERAASLAAIAAQEREQMADPANWITVHVIAGQATDAGSLWQVEELPGWFFISNIPEKTVRYFQECYALAYKAAAVKSRIAQADDLIRQSADQKAQLANEGRAQQALQDRANTAVQVDSFYDPNNFYYIDPRVNDWARDIQQRTDQLDADVAKVTNAKQSDEDELSRDEQQMRALTSSRGESDTAITIFVSRHKLQGYHILICK